MPGSEAMSDKEHVPSVRDIDDAMKPQALTPEECESLERMRIADTAARQIVNQSYTGSVRQPQEEQRIARETAYVSRIIAQAIADATAGLRTRLAALEGKWREDIQKRRHDPNTLDDLELLGMCAGRNMAADDLKNALEGR